MSQLTAPATHTALLALQRLNEPADLLPLEGDKITIGGGQSCTLRLADPGIRPVHCLVTVVADDLVVRRWSDETLLNGETFSEAPLVVGDRLTIGPVDLELVAHHDDECLSDDHELESHEHFEQTRAETPAACDTTAELEPDASTTVAVERAAHNRSRARHLVGEVRRSRQAYQELQLSLSEMEAKVVAIETERSDLADQRADLDSQLEQMQAQIAELNDELFGARQFHEEREQQLTDQVGDLDRQVVERNDIIEQLKAELLRRHSPKESTPSDWVVADHVEATEAAEQDSPAEWENGSADAVDTDGQLADWPEETADQPTDDFGDDASSTDDVELIDEEWNNEQSEQALEAPADAELWDVEVQNNHQDGYEAYAESTSTDADKDSEVTRKLDTDDQLGDAAVGSLEDKVAESGEPNDEEELWGRLNSLRAVASGKLHGDVGGAFDSQVAESYETAVGQPAEAAHNEQDLEEDESLADAPSDSEAIDVHAELRQQPSLDATADTPVAAQRETNESIEAEAPVPASDVPQPANGVDEPTATVPTTLFDRPTETEDQPAGCQEQVSFVEKYQHLLEEEPASELSSPPTMSEPEPVLPTPDDESIEDYMEKMMDRLRSGADAAAHGAQATQPENTSAPEASLAAAAVETEPKTEAPLTDLDQLKSSPMPEQSTDMSALRDLANNSARHAIQLANSKRARGQAYGNLLLSSVAGGSGAFLVWSSQGALGTSLFGGAAAVAAAGYWACRIVRSLAQPMAKSQPLVTDDSSSKVALPITGTSSSTKDNQSV